ncbi:hypothetical protein GCM10025865_15530 [Paraoerskovia sediminicola]|uniref:Uncharacterized protein n=1 Tax=Paraoerskovia sediminicola TaxID=1138587 RepID=A0ABM8G2I9_9CELL|nr:hypothetical protein [Paraoerskovia sediminicola]BDZ42254.1 hypothetical protein GCM10025865_15530 [Paraoerskovia sediminicola]
MYVTTDLDSGKVKRIRNGSRVRLQACDMKGAVHGPAVAGRARVVDDPTLEKGALAGLKAKYGLQFRLIGLLATFRRNTGERVILELVPDALPAPAQEQD